MRINDKLKIRQVVGENIVIMPGNNEVDMTRVIALNESALTLFNALHGHDFEIEDAVKVLTDEYEVDAATARRDVDAWLADMTRNNLMS